MGFEFVLLNDKNNQVKIKNHLRARQSEQRRKKLKEWKQASVALKTNSIVGLGPLPWRVKSPSDEDDQEGQDESDRPASSSSSSAPRKALPKRLKIAKQTHRSSALVRRDNEIHNSSLSARGEPVRAASPLTIIGAARKDPFRTYPIPWHADIDSLLDLYAYSLGPHLYAYTPNPSHDILRSHGLPVSMHSPAAFHANMFMAAVQKDRLDRRSLPGVRALWHRVEAIRLVNEALTSGNRELVLSEATIYTVLALTIMERHWKAVGSQETRALGLQHLLIQKGGLTTLSKLHPVLEHTLYGIALVTPRMLSSGSPALYSADQPHYGQVEENQALAHELIQFFTVLVGKSDLNSDLFSKLAFAFGPGTSMHKLLISPPSHALGHLPPQAILVQDCCRVSVLLHVHCIVNSLSKRADFGRHVKHLHWVLRQEWIWQKSIRMLHYLVVKDEETAALMDPEIAWKVLRLSSTMGWLSPELYEMGKEYMLGLLSGTWVPSLDVRRFKMDLDQNM